MTTTPLRTPICPRCGQPNGCTPAATGTFEGGCWCETVAFPPSLLREVPVAERGRSCLCRHCATTYDNGPRTAPGHPG